MGATRIDRKLFPAGRPAALLAAAALGLCLTPAALHAGSVFMKNGYIIQGPVLEYSEGSDGAVVLGWANGKMTIYRRFIEKVDLEPGEEKNVKVAEEKSPDPEDLLVKSAVDEDLPANLSDFVEKIGLPKALIESGKPPEGGILTTAEGAGKPPAAGGETPPAGGEEGPRTTPGPSGAELATDVNVVKPPPALALAARSTAPGWGFSLEPPSGWNLDQVDGASPGPVPRARRDSLPPSTWWRRRAVPSAGRRPAGRCATKPLPA